MIQQQIIKDIKGRLQYDFCKGKHKDKKLEFMGSVCSDNFSEKVFNTLSRKDLLSSNQRVAREIIVPIPHCLARDINKQKVFINNYMSNLKDLYGLENDFMWNACIHNKYNNGIKSNYHAHILFSERPLLDKPIKKHFQKRYYNEFGKQCNKSQAHKLANGELLCVKAHDEVLYFDKKYTNKENKPLFASMHFCYDCDQIWKDTVLEMGLLNKKDLENIFIENSNARHLGCKDKANHLSKVKIQREHDNWFNVFEAKKKGKNLEHNNSKELER